MALDGSDIRYSLLAGHFSNREISGGCSFSARGMLVVSLVCVPGIVWRLRAKGAGCAEHTFLQMWKYLS